MSETLVSSLLVYRERERARQDCLDKITSGEASNIDNNQATVESSSSLFLIFSLWRKIINEPNSKLCCQSQSLLCLTFLSDSQTLGLWCPCAKLVNWTIISRSTYSWEIDCHGRDDRTRQSGHNPDLKLSVWKRASPTITIHRQLLCGQEYVARAISSYPSHYL